MGSIFGKIGAAVLFMVYASMIMGLVETVLEVLVGPGSLMDWLWMIAAVVGLPLSGALTGLTLYLYYKLTKK